MKTFLKSGSVLFMVFLALNLDAQINSGYTIGFNMARMKLIIPGKNPKQETMTGIHFGRIYAATHWDAGYERDGRAVG